MTKCCICDGEIEAVGDWTSGNDAWPVAEGRCCNRCDMEVVVKARLDGVRDRQRAAASTFYVVYHEPSDMWQLCLRSGMPCMARRPLATVLENCHRTASARPSKGFAWPLPVMHVRNDDVAGVWEGWLSADGQWTNGTWTRVGGEWVK